MYPKSIKIESNNSTFEYVYSPAYHEDEFEVINVDNPDNKAIFIIDPINRTFQSKISDFSLFDNEIGERILFNEYLNSRGE